MRRFHVRTAVVLPLVLGGTLAARRAPAYNEVEVGGFVGAHLFSPSSELGRVDLDPRDNAPQHAFAPGLRLGFAPHPRLMIEGELALFPTRTRDGQAALVALGYRAHLLVHLLTGRVRPFLLAGAGAISSVYSADANLLGLDTDEAFHAGAGVKIGLTRRLGLRLDSRVLIVPRIEDASVAPEGEVMLGLYWRWDDRRPPRPKAPAPEPVRAPPDARPVPPPEIPPAPAPQPEAPAPAPAPPAPPPDRDGDGFPDQGDTCPDQPETKNGFADQDGCPDEVPRAVARFTGVIKGINFKTGKDTILKSSYKVLKAAAKVLREYPDLRVEISGHTDSAGSREANLDLSQRRAEAVRRYLVQQGLAEGRLRAVGYGPDRPLADNRKKAGKARNRRVEFKLLSP
jgi:OOP family OmpA-OmpF porin